MQINNFNKSVMCSLEVEGVHRWAECDIDEVAYLRDPHRHMFTIRCWFKVEHNDRDIEFIRMKHIITKLLNKYFFDKKTWLMDFGTKSCEDIAEWLITLLINTSYPVLRVEVLEDGENGSILELIKECACQKN